MSKKDRNIGMWTIFEVKILSTPILTTDLIPPCYQLTLNINGCKLNKKGLLMQLALYIIEYILGLMGADINTFYRIYIYDLV